MSENGGALYPFLAGLVIFGGAFLLLFAILQRQAEENAWHGERLACIEQALAVPGSQAEEETRERDLARRSGYLEAVLGLKAPESHMGWDYRIARIHGTAERLGHDVEPCLGANGEEA